ncbi:hypothetical protein QQ045_015676 [Rhodiola kirilowii]
MKRSEPLSIIHYLPEDMLHQIFSHLDDIDDLKSTWLVCKQFCSVSSRLVQGLSLRHSSLTYSEFERLFKRFPGVKEICINFRKVDKALMAISNSGLNLEKLQIAQYRSIVQFPNWQIIEIMSTSRVITSIKYLQLSRFHFHSKDIVIDFVNLFPSLTEFTFTYCIQWNDDQIHKLTSKHPNLQKINLSYSDAMTDKTLDILSSNCPKLETVNFEGCEEFSAEAMYRFFFNNPQLSSVALPYFESPSISKVSKVVKGLQLLKNLNRLSIDFDIVQDAFLIGLAESPPPLKHLQIDSHSEKCTIAGLSKLLSVCPDLESLVIHLPDTEICDTHDADMSNVVKRLPYLKEINILSHGVVCRETLFSLVNNCPLLKKILLTRKNEDIVKQVYYDHGLARPSMKNYSIKSIVITSPKDSDLWLRSMIQFGNGDDGEDKKPKGEDVAPVSFTDRSANSTVSGYEEDDVLQLIDAEVNRARKLRKEDGESVIDVAVYVARLRAHHVKLNPSTEWAKLDLKPQSYSSDGEDSDEEKGAVVARHDRDIVEVDDILD